MTNGKLFTKAVATMLGASLAVAGVPAVAVVADGVAGADAGIAYADELAAFPGNVTATLSDDGKTVKLAGYGAGTSGRGASAVKYDAMANPKATVTCGDAAYATDAAVGEDGSIALDGAIAVGEYTVVVASDNFAPKTVKFSYPVVAEAAIGGATYQYLDAAKALALVDADAQAAALQGFAPIGETGVYYKVKDGSTALAGTLYGTDMTKVTSYTDLYKSMGATQTAAADYDAISSATGIVANKHYPYLSKLVAQDIKYDATALGTATEVQRLENKIVGAYATATSVSDATAYVEAYILNAAGKTLADAQKALLDVRLNGNATVDPTTVKNRVEIDMAQTYGFSTGYTYFTQYVSNPAKHYGDTKITIHPKAGLDGASFSWADYYSSLYAATLEDSNGNKVGMAPWVDLYAEAGHQAVEIAIKNGVNKYADNGATVNRYAKMYDAKTGRLKAGICTVTVYAAGYNPLEYTFVAPGVGVTSDYKSVELENVDLSGMTNPTVNVKRVLTVDSLEGEVEDASYAENVTPVDGKVALAKEAIDGDYQVDVVDNADPANPVTTSSYTFTLNKKAYEEAVAADKPAEPALEKQTITLKKKSVTYKAKALKKAKKTFSIGAAAKGKLTYSVTAKVKNAGVTVSKAGKVTVKKGTKKGTYKVTVKAAKTSEYKAASATVKVTVK